MGECSPTRWPATAKQKAPQNRFANTSNKPVLQKKGFEQQKANKIIPSHPYAINPCVFMHLSKNGWRRKILLAFLLSIRVFVFSLFVFNSGLFVFSSGPDQDCLRDSHFPETGIRGHGAADAIARAQRAPEPFVCAGPKAHTLKPSIRANIFLSSVHCVHHSCGAAANAKQNHPQRDGKIIIPSVKSILHISNLPRQPS